MSDADARDRAAALGLVPVRRWGFCFLWPARGGPFAARAETWEGCFELVRLKIPAEPIAPPPVVQSAALCSNGPRTLFDELE